MKFRDAVHTDTATIAAALRALADQLDKRSVEIAPTHVSVSLQVLSDWPTPSHLRAEAVEDMARMLDVDQDVHYRHPGELYGTGINSEAYSGALAVCVFGKMPIPGDLPEAAAA